VQRYGDFVLYRPPVKSSTWLLWGGPFLLLGAALVGLVLSIRRRRVPASMPLQRDEAERARRLLGEEKS
jgi:cytochrome c-type biogenesis protein CcmH